MDSQTPIKAIRAFCLECVANQWKLVETCPIRDCPLWVYRFGIRPATAAAKGKDVVPQRAA